MNAATAPNKTAPKGKSKMNGWTKTILVGLLMAALSWSFAEVRSNDIEKVNNNTDSIKALRAVDSVLAADIQSLKSDVGQIKREGKRSTRLLLLLAEELDVSESKIEATKVEADTADSN